MHSKNLQSVNNFDTSPPNNGHILEVTLVCSNVDFSKKKRKHLKHLPVLGNEIQPFQIGLETQDYQHQQA